MPRSHICPIATAVTGFTDDIHSISVSDRIATPSRASPSARSASVVPSRDT
ncbi:MAG TPA: hypothetical protein VIX59_15280 [Candidatus Binataceae bacterium]